MKLEHTLYDVLEVSQQASAIVVRAAYRSLAQSLHPDKHLGSKASCERLVEINAAYSVLSDPLRRLKYDQTLALKNGPVERRSLDTASSSVGCGHGRTGHDFTRPFAFRPLV